MGGTVADLIPQDSNVYDVAIVLIITVMGYLQLRLRTAQKATQKHVAHTSAKALATREVLPPKQKERAKEVEEEILNGDDHFRNREGYYP